MTDFKAAPGQRDELKGWAGHGSTVACILELRDRVAKLEAQASNYPVIPNSSTPPPVATDEELRAAYWNVPGTNLDAFRAIYNLGVAHGQASSREVADPAPVAPNLKEQALDELHISFDRGYLKAGAAETIRRALEALPND